MGPISCLVFNSSISDEANPSEAEGGHHTAQAVAPLGGGREELFESTQGQLSMLQQQEGMIH